jgi:hypothetical protein
MRDRGRNGNLLGYVDISMNLLMCFIVLFVLAFVMMRPRADEADTRGKLATTSKLVIHMTWDSTSDDDVDLWVKTDSPFSVVGFKGKSSVNMYLDNDSLGKSSNAVLKSDGVASTFGNNEHMHVKECTNTRVTVNLHYYRGQSGRPVSARVELIRIDPLGIVHTSMVELDKPGQERTAMQFRMDEDCNVTEITQVQSNFVMSKLSGQGSIPQIDGVGQ